MFDKESIQNKIVDLLSNRFEIPFGNDVDYDTDLFENGFIDSLESLVVISFIEKNFQISISPDDLIENPMKSVNEMVSLVCRMKGL